MPNIYVVLLLLAFMFFIQIRFGKPADRSCNLNAVFFALGNLLAKGVDCDFMVVEIGQTDRFVQVRKYIKPSGEYGIEMGFPRVQWSEDYFDHAVEVCERMMEPSLVSQRVMKDGVEFLYADFGQNLAMANDMVRTMLTEVFSVDDSTKLYLKGGKHHPYK